MKTWRKTGGRKEWRKGKWESYSNVKQLAQWFLTARCASLMPPAQRPRSELRRNRRTEVEESVRKRPEDGKFSKLNRETSHQQAGSLDWMFGGAGRGVDGARVMKRDKDRNKKKMHICLEWSWLEVLVSGLGAIIDLLTIPPSRSRTPPPTWNIRRRSLQESSDTHHYSTKVCDKTTPWEVLFFFLVERCWIEFPLKNYHNETYFPLPSTMDRHCQCCK